jgi:hypothetical protein
MALLPFIRAAERPADLPAFVISPRLSDPTPPDIRIYAVAGRTAIVGGALLASSGDERLVALAAGKHAPAGAVEVGGIARGIAIDWPSSILYQALDVREAVR